MTAENDKSKYMDTNVAEYVLKTVRAEKKSIVTGLIVRIVILALVLSYMSYMYVKVSHVNADTIVATARDKLSQQLPSITTQLAIKLKDSAPDVMKRLEERSLEAIPELSAHLEDVIKQRIKDELGPLLEQELTDLLRENITVQFAKMKEAQPDLFEDENLDALTDAIVADFKTNAVNSIEITLEKVKYWEKMKEINNWLCHLQCGEALTERECYQRELICATLKMIQVKTGGGLVRKTPLEFGDHLKMPTVPK